jgi:hypothetical protein
MKTETLLGNLVRHVAKRMQSTDKADLTKGQRK